ncbi:MAG: methyl-accepting chemotaxis protein, partial [Neptuniibacter pectenicola]
MSLYKSVEKTCFNSLTKKITGNVVFLLLPHVVLLLIGYNHFNKLDSSLASGHVSTAVIQQQLDSFWLYGLATVIFALISGILTIFFMRHLFLRPIRKMTDVLQAIKDKDGDISATLPEYTYDEISEMAESYNTFS